MKTSVICIHGGEAYSDYNAFLDVLKNQPIDPFAPTTVKWRSTLASELGSDHEVLIPQMPNKENAQYLEWKIWFERHIPYLRDGAILIGHSQGGYFLTKYLIENDLPFQVKTLYLVAAPFEPDDFGGEDGGDFAFDTSKVGILEKKVDRIVIFHSQDDPVVPYAHALKFSQSLPKAELITFQEKGHFWQESFPELVEDIKELP